MLQALSLFLITILSNPLLILAHPLPELSFNSLFQSFSKRKGYFAEKEKGKTMSRRNGSAPKLDLKLNLSPPRADDRRLESPNRSATPSPPSSCVSIELNQEDKYSNSPEATSMVLVGCPRCLMYVMLSEDDPKCPKCKSTVLLDFLHDNNINNNNSNNNIRRN